MADPHFEFFKKTQSTLGNPQPELLEAEVLAPVVGSAVPVGVQQVDDASGGRLALGAAPFPQPVGSGAPHPGDKCLVAFDQNRKPWIIAWAHSGWPGQPAALGVVASLPTEPRDGEVVNFLADATNGIVWQLRYRAASASTHKWEFIGGPPIKAQSMTAQTFTMQNEVWTEGTALNVVIPLSGDYNARSTTTIRPASASCTSWMGMGVNIGTPELDASTACCFHSVVGARQCMTLDRLVSANASDIVRQMYRQAAPEQSFVREGSSIEITPVRIG